MFILCTYDSTHNKLKQVAYTRNTSTTIDKGKAGACLRTNSKYAGGGHGRGIPYVRKKNQDMNLKVASPAFSEHKHRLNCFPNKSEKQSKSYWSGS